MTAAGKGGNFAVNFMNQLKLNFAAALKRNMQ